MSLCVLGWQRFIGCRVGRGSSGFRSAGFVGGLSVGGGFLVLLSFDLLYFIFCLCLPSADIFCPPFLPALRAVFIGYRLFLGVFYGLIGLAIGSAVIGAFCLWFFLFF